jgi:HSP20 family protein
MKRDLIRKEESINPFWGLNSLHRDVDRLFDHFTSRPWMERSFEEFIPACDFEELGDLFLARFDLPGMKLEDIHVEVLENQLIVTGERKEEKTDARATHYVSEISAGKFRRTFALPTSVEADKIEATYKDGVLRVLLPKSSTIKARRVQVKEGWTDTMKRLFSRAESERKETH